MEPGREDREHMHPDCRVLATGNTPQWNPAVKTGSTCGSPDTTVTSDRSLNGTRP